jgi:hypothetical protein
MRVRTDRGAGQIARELGISRKTVETHREHIKVRLDYPDAEALHRGARESLGAAERPGQNPDTSIGDSLGQKIRALPDRQQAYETLLFSI